MVILTLHAHARLTCSSLHQSHRWTLNHLISLSFCIFFEIRGFFPLDISASTFKWLVKDAEEYKNITSFRRKCRLVYNRLEIKVRTYAPGQDGQKGTEFMLLPETTKTKTKPRQNSCIFETMVFNALNTRK